MPFLSVVAVASSRVSFMSPDATNCLRDGSNNSALRKIQGIAGPGKTISGTASVFTPPATSTLSSPIAAAAK